MIASIMEFLSTEGFQPHGLCLLWRPDMFWAHVVSDALIALSYFSIPVALVVFALRRRDLVYRWVLFLFGAFIVACGISHLAAIWTMWVPDYGMQAVVKLATAAISLLTAVLIWPLLPRLLAIPSRRQLEEKNEALAAEIASREQVERELRMLNEELERRVHERTEALEEQNAALAFARQAADRSNEAKSQFLAAMSHEIRTPMHGVLGMLDLLREDRLTRDQHELVDRALGAARGLMTIINDILDYSKLQSGAVELSPERFSPRKVIEDTLAIMRARAREKGVRLEAAFDRDLVPEVSADPLRFGQVLLNLVSNAVKFTEVGSVTVSAASTLDPGGRCELAVTVRDTGIGIAEEHRDRLFLRFSQADPSIARRFGGTGLGLAISRQLVELMGGQIGFTSAAGEGSTFRFTIAASLAERDRVDQAVALQPVRLRPQHERFRVLVAEDNETNRFYVRHLLGREGHHVVTVTTGREAVDAARAGAFDVILMDVCLPDIDGPEAVRRIRETLGPSAGAPIVAFTANAMAGDRETFLALGMDEYVSKPIDRPRFLAVLQQVVAAARGRAAGASCPPEAPRAAS